MYFKLEIIDGPLLKWLSVTGREKWTVFLVLVVRYITLVYLKAVATVQGSGYSFKRRGYR